MPTVAGETQFHEGYNGNILVNAMAVGLADQDKIFYARGATPGNPIFYVGSKTGRDGIHGATMASANSLKVTKKNARLSRSATLSRRNSSSRRVLN